MAKIVVLATGGTIAGKAKHAHETVVYQSAKIQVDDLVGHIAGLDAVLQEDTLVTEQIVQMDSKDMNFSVWQQLLVRSVFWLEQPDVRGVVVTHGTDTLEETAFFLQQALAYCPNAHTWHDKALVLTCAMRPASARMFDGAQNITDACCVVRNYQACGVLVVCAGAVHHAKTVQKIHPYRLDAFSSGDVGNVAWVEANQVRWLYAPHAWQHNRLSTDEREKKWHTLLNTLPSKFPWVELLHSYTGVDNRALMALVHAGVQGIILVGTGNATYHKNLHLTLQAARDAGVALTLTSRCYASAVVRSVDVAQNIVELAYEDTEHSITLAPAKARIHMILRLMLQ